MSKLLRKLQRIGKRSIKYRVEVVYRELELTCVERWQPNKLIINWSHHSRHEQTASHSLEPSIAQPSLGYVRWPPAGERHVFGVTLYFDPFTQSYDEKWWLLTVEELTRSGERRVLAKLHVSINDLAICSRVKPDSAFVTQTVSDGGDTGEGDGLHPRTFELRTVSSKVRIAKLRVDFRVQPDAEALSEQVPPVLANTSDVQTNVAVPQRGLRRFSTRVRETFRRRRNAPATRSERLPRNKVEKQSLTLNIGVSKELAPIHKSADLDTQSRATEKSEHVDATQDTESVGQPLETKLCEENPPTLNGDADTTCVIESLQAETETVKTSHTVTPTNEITAPTPVCDRVKPQTPVLVNGTSPVSPPSAPSVKVQQKVDPDLQPVSLALASASASASASTTVSVSLNTSIKCDGTPAATPTQSPLPAIIQTPTVQPSVSSEQDELLAWCKAATADCRTVRITNLTTSFRNGLAFCAIIHHFRPDFIDVTKLNAGDMVENNRRAFDMASRYFGIALLIEPSAIVGSFIPDKSCVTNYVSALRDYFTKHPHPTDHELELQKADSAKLPDAHDNGVDQEDDDNELVELRNGTPNNDGMKRTSSTSAKKVLGALKKRSSTGLQKLLGVGRSSSTDADADNVDKDKDKRVLAHNGADHERTERAKSTESDSARHIRSADGHHAQAEVPAIEEQRSHSAHLIAAEPVLADKQPNEAVQLTTPTAASNLNVVRASRVVADSAGSPTSAGVVLRPVVKDSHADSETDSSSHHRSSHHRTSKLFKRSSKHHDDTEANEHKTVVKPSAVVAPATRISMPPAAPSPTEKRELLSPKVAELLAGVAPKAAVSSELGGELAKIEGEMSDVDARLTVVEARLRETMHRRARTIDSHAAQQHTPDNSATVSSKLGGAFSRTFSMRKTPQAASPTQNLASKAAEAEREEQQLVKQRVALTNHKNTLVHKLNRLNLLQQDEDLERLNQALKDQLQEFSKVQDWEKSDEQRKLEERLTAELLEIVAKRNQIVMDIDENEQELEKAIELEEKMRNVVLDSAHGEQCVIS